MRSDLKLLTPWVARPTDAHRPEAQWEVVAPGKNRNGRHQLVACMLDESDARAIAAAWESLYAVRRAVLDVQETRRQPSWLDEAVTALEKANVPTGR